MEVSHSITLAHELNINSRGFSALIEVQFSRAALLQVFGVRLSQWREVWRRGATSVTASCSHYWCDYIRWNPPQGADTAGAQAVRGWDFCQRPFHLSPPSSASSPLPLLHTTQHHPQTVAPLFGLPLWIEERADKSLHGDSAICKSCCGRRVFSFPFLPPSLPTSCLYKTAPFSPSHSCIPSPRLIRFPQQFKNPLPWSTLSPLPHFFTLHPITFFPPFHSLLALML